MAAETSAAPYPRGPAATHCLCALAGNPLHADEDVDEWSDSAGGDSDNEDDFFVGGVDNDIDLSGDTTYLRRFSGFT